MRRRPRLQFVNLDKIFQTQESEMLRDQMATKANRCPPILKGVPPQREEDFLMHLEDVGVQNLQWS